MFLNLVRALLKWSLISTFAFVMYLIYKLIIRPLRFRSLYKKYPNVYVTPKFIPIKGDAKEFLDDANLGKSKICHKIRYASMLDKHDMRLFTAGAMVLLHLNSLKAFNELIEKSPEFIDRFDNLTKSFAKLCPKSILFTRTTEAWKQRREGFLREMGLNQASKFIPIMVNACCERMDTWQKDKSYNLQYEINLITFKVITIILFGKEVNNKIKSIDYEKKDGSIAQLSFSDYFVEVSKDIQNNTFHPIGLLFPILADYDLINPYKRDRKNIERMKAELKSFLDSSKDDESIYYKLLTGTKIDHESLFEDLIGFLFAGRGTSSHAITSAVYFLNKYPETKAKLMDELKVFDGKSSKELVSLITPGKLSELSYLYNVNKEILRIDSPAAESIPYSVYKDTTICGVPLKKGAIITSSLISQHYNPKLWKDPLKFIPERFDPNSKYFTCPETEKQRPPLALSPFSFGNRICAGQTLAMLEIKVMIICLMSKMEFKIDKALLENDFIYFTLLSQNECIFQPVPK